MASKLRITTAAEDDLEMIFQRYEGQRPGLGTKFMERFHACAKRVVESPEMFAKVSGDFRRAMLRKFPYAVFYEFAHDEVTIHGVLHTARDSSAWQSRIE